MKQNFFKKRMGEGASPKPLPSKDGQHKPNLELLIEKYRRIEIKEGDAVEHPIFGKGRVKEVFRDRARVEFGRETKLILISYLKKVKAGESKSQVKKTVERKAFQIKLEEEEKGEEEKEREEEE